MSRLSALLALSLAPACPSTALPSPDSPPLATWRGHSSEVGAAAFSPDGTKVLSASSDDTLRLWDTATGEALAVWKDAAVESDSIAFTPDGKRALLGGEDHSLIVLEVATGKKLAALKGHYGQIRSIALSPDGRTAATTSFYGSLKLWDIEEGKLLADLHTGPEAGAISVAFSPDGRRLLSGMWHKVIWLWDVEKRKREAVWEGHSGRVLSVAFSPDGTKALSGARDNTLRLWDAASGRGLAVWRGHSSHVYSVAFSPDGRAALSGGSDYTLRKWDVPTGETLAVWRGHQGDVRSVSFSPDGRLAVSASEDYTLKLWDVSGRAAASGAPPRSSPPPSFRPRPEAGESEEEWLGRLLFFDRRISGDSARSCASCHIPEKAFTDGLALSSGYPDTLYFRNTPTLLNAAAHKHLYWDGRFPGGDLASLIRDHISEAHFMHSDGRLIVEKLRQMPGYVQAFRGVYESEPTYGNILEALAAYVRSLKSRESRYDRFLRGETAALSAKARRGRELFFGAAGCAECHGGTLFTDGELHGRGVPENPDIFAEPRRHISFRRFFKLLGIEGYSNLRRDEGLYAVTKEEADRGKFKTPSLRDAARTAPYMHNGVFRTLEEAVAFEAPRLDKRGVVDIVEFLESLDSAPQNGETPALPEYAAHRRMQAVEPDAPRSDAPLPPVSGFPPLGPLPPVPVPNDNPLTPEKIELGGMLFHDFRISGDGETYCMACHEPEMGWGDNSDMAQGHPGTLHWRNAQTVLNSAYYTKLDWDGAQASLEEQARNAITSNISGNADPVMIEERLAQVPEYVELFKKAFGAQRPNFEGVLKALASFLRAVPISRDVPFDRYANGDESALSAAARRGMALFTGRAACIRCHNGPLVTDQGYHATGVPRNPAFDSVALRQVTVRYQHFLRGVPEDVYRDADSDPGLYLTTQRPEDRGKFRTPSLRELAVTAPYMHNGVFPALSDVVEFYDQGGGSTPNKTPLLRPLKLTPGEKKDLIAFLESLSGGRTPARYPIRPEPDYITLDGRALRVK